MTKGEIVVAEATEVTVQRPVDLPDVGRMMDAALAQGPEGVEALEKLVDMQMRILDRQAESSLTVALAEFKNGCPPIRKTKKIDYATKSGRKVKFEYAPLEEIQRTVDPVLHRFGLSYTFDTKATEKSVQTTVRLQHVDGAFRESSVTLPVSGPQDSPAQQYGGTITYGKRYALGDVLGITIEDDVDGAQPGTPITDEQAATLREYLDRPEVNAEGFLRYMGVSVLSELGSDRYEDALRALRTKVGQ